MHYGFDKETYTSVKTLNFNIDLAYPEVLVNLNK